MVEICEIVMYATPILTAFANVGVLKYRLNESIDWTTIGISTLIVLCAYVVYFVYTNNCGKASKKDEGEILKLKQENAGLKSNLMKIHRDIMPGPRDVRNPKVTFENKQPIPKMPQQPMKIEEVVEKGSGVFSEAEDAKPFAQ